MGGTAFNLIMVLLIVVIICDLYRKLGSLQKESGPWEENGGKNLPPVTSRKASKIIITHTDWDGLTSGALLLRLAGKDAGVIFTSPAGIPSAIAAASAGLTAGDELFIADLALSPERERAVRPELEDLRRRGVAVNWFDHHEWPAGLAGRIGRICATFELDSNAATAAELIRPRLSVNDEYADRLIRFVRRHALPGENEWDRHWRYVLSELTSMQDTDLMETVLHNWAEDAPASPAEKYLAEKGRKREELTETMAKYKHRKVSTSAGKHFLVIDVRPKRLERDEKGKLFYVVRAPEPSVMVGPLACRHHEAEFCLVVWSNDRYSLYRGTDRSLSFESLFPEIRIRKYRYRVTGHFYAASVRVFSGVWNGMISMFRWRLPPQTEALIRFLAEKF